MDTQILYPQQGSLVRWKETVFSVFGGDDVRGPVFYVLANDGLWYRQAPAHQFLGPVYTARCVFGVQENRSGWSYQVVAVSSHDALPETFTEIPVDLAHSVPVWVTRR